jgi:membrane-associated phospholipid phosphatase
MRTRDASHGATLPTLGTAPVLFVAHAVDVRVRAGVLVAALAAVVMLLGLLSRWFERHRDGIWRWLDARWRRVVAAPAVQRARERHPRLVAFLARRVSRTEYLGLHLTVGLAISVAALAAFARLADPVVEARGQLEVDTAVATALHRYATAHGATAAKIVTTLGAPSLVGVFVLVATVALAVQGRRLLAAGVALAALGSLVLDAELKHVFQRPRPVWDDPILTLDSWSFPSGHSLGSLVNYGMLAYVIVLHVPRRAARVAVVVAAALLTLGVGFTRMYLGVHYLTDVLGGYAAGAVWLTTCVTGLEVARRRPPARATRQDAYG